MREKDPCDWVDAWRLSVGPRDSQWDDSCHDRFTCIYARVYTCRYIVEGRAGIKRHNIWPGNFLIAPRKILVIVNSRLIILKRVEAPGAFSFRM